MSVFHLTDRQDKLVIQEKEEMFLFRTIHRSVLMKVKVSPRGKSFGGTLFHSSDEMRPKHLSVQSCTHKMDSELQKGKTGRSLLKSY